MFRSTSHAAARLAYCRCCSRPSRPIRLFGSFAIVIICRHHVRQDYSFRGEQIVLGRIHHGRAEGFDGVAPSSSGGGSIIGKCDRRRCGGGAALGTISLQGGQLSSCWRLIVIFKQCPRSLLVTLTNRSLIRSQWRLAIIFDRVDDGCALPFPVGTIAQIQHVRLLAFALGGAASGRGRLFLLSFQCSGSSSRPPSSMGGGGGD